MTLVQVGISTVQDNVSRFLKITGHTPVSFGHVRNRSTECYVLPLEGLGGLGWDRVGGLTV